MWKGTMEWGRRTLKKATLPLQAKASRTMGRKWKMTRGRGKVAKTASKGKKGNPMLAMSVHVVSWFLPSFRPRTLTWEGPWLSAVTSETAVVSYGSLCSKRRQLWHLLIQQ